MQSRTFSPIRKPLFYLNCSTKNTDNMSTQKWHAIDLAGSEKCYQLEFQTTAGEWVNFDAIPTAGYVVFGNACNTGLLQSGFLKTEEGESIDEALAELVADLEAYYNEGPKAVSRIVCNERM